MASSKVYVVGTAWHDDMCAPYSTGGRDISLVTLYRDKAEQEYSNLQKKCGSCSWPYMSEMTLGQKDSEVVLKGSTY